MLFQWLFLIAKLKENVKRVVSYRVTIIFFTATGSTPLNLENKYLSIDWRNYPRSPDFVDVDEKKDWVC